MPARKTHAEDVIRLPDADVPSTLKPWERRPRETAKAFACFQAYCKLGAGRSTLKLKFQIGCSAVHLRRLSARWDWVERSRHWDDHMAAAEMDAKARVRSEESELWERRRMEAARANWERAQKVAAKGMLMLEGDLYKDEVCEDGTIKPAAKWSMKDAIAFLKVAAELQAMALGEATGEVDDGFDPSKATPDECRAWLTEQGIEVVGQKALPAPKRE